MEAPLRAPAPEERGENARRERRRRREHRKTTRVARGGFWQRGGGVRPRESVLAPREAECAREREISEREREVVLQFTDCVDTFRRKTLDKQEETCVKRCAEKFLKHSMCVGMRFTELNQGAATSD
ncbi:Mitochondrial import inner membrane translocase subunit Tim9 [Carex littledalei]|uniref:Mitochondrial import inner membrane translocase subunit n=1 Tax=Carex littledalei TaxID=544730 RepID=A0A833V4M2_9POAL|nr:Mitochondrial import inner membrane translocase subunit Tim9 [Carex littledalei]